MAGPVVTTLLTPNPASGNTTMDGSEDVLASSASLGSSGIFLPQLDLTNMADGDVIEVRIYNQANSTSSLVQSVYVSFSNGQSDIVPPLPALPATIGYKVTAKQTAGTNRAINWSVLNLLGT